MKRMFTLILLAAAGLFSARQVQAQIIFTVNEPAGISGFVSPIGAPDDAFGGELQPGESISGDLAIALTDDPDSLSTYMGCDSIINPVDLVGKIALIHRGSPPDAPGTCFFSNKVWYAQQAGAVGVVICNNLVGDEILDGYGAGGTWAGLDTIPSCMISYNDCVVIKAAIEAGETVNVTFFVPGFQNPGLSYAYHTPKDHIIPLEDIRVTLINTTGSEGNDITFTCDIEDPDGNITTLEKLVEVLPAGADTIVTFDSYTPTVEGTYTGVFTNTLTSDVLTETFIITDKLFATDRGTVTLDAGNQTSFAVANGYRYHYGSLYQTGEIPSIATHVSFGIGNAAEIFTDNPDFDVFTLLVYNGDADDNELLDFATTNASFDDLTAVGLGTYAMTGDEGAQEILTVEVLPTSGGVQFIELDTLGTYYAAFKYDGDPTAASVCPRMVGTGDVNYFAFTTPLVIGNTFFNAGWLGAICVSRLHIDETIDNVKDVVRLDPAKARIFPNPAKDNVNLELNLENLADRVRVDILNFDSKVVGTYELENVRNGVYPFNTEHLASGTYFLSVKTPEGYRSLVFTVVR